jgi:hypothetical protein
LAASAAVYVIEGKKAEPEIPPEAEPAEMVGLAVGRPG